MMKTSLISWDCDSPKCGAHEMMSTVLPPEGWYERGDQQFCADCRRRHHRNKVVKLDDYRRKQPR